MPPVIKLKVEPRQYHHLFVKDVLPKIIYGIKIILNIDGLPLPKITIPEQHYNDEIPYFSGISPRTFLKINFDYWVSSEHLYQNQLEVSLVWHES